MPKNMVKEMKEDVKKEDSTQEDNQDSSDSEILREKIKDIDNISKKEYEEGVNWFDVEKETCSIDGEEYHICIAKICNVINSDSMPVVTFIGDPGSGKTMAMSKLIEILHDEVNLLRGEAKPRKNLNYDPIEFLETILSERRVAVGKPEANTSFNSKDFNEIDNRKNGNAINLSRTFSNLLIYDGQYLWETDTSIKNKDSIRFVAAGGNDSYLFDVFKIERENDDEKKETTKIHLGRWSPDLPSDKFQSHVESMDTEWKIDKLESDVKEMKENRENKNGSEFNDLF